MPPCYVAENFAKLLKIMQNYTVEWRESKFILVFHFNYYIYLVPSLKHSTSNNGFLMKIVLDGP